MSKVRSNTSLIVSALIMLAVMLTAGVAFDYYFDLNDDVLMKDILSGAYTGVPESRNIQMLYPISLLISLFYKIAGKVDWYGFFLCGCQFVCFTLIFDRILKKSAHKSLKYLYLLAALFILIGAFLPHLIFVQYTVVCGLLSATAAFLIVTEGAYERKDTIIALILLIVAFLIRTEMMLLTLPMVGVAILIRFVLGSKQRDMRAEFAKYAALCVGIGVALVACTAISKISYSSPEWKEFYRFFDNRTELYDFQYIPDYAENKDFYDSIGLSKSEQELLVNYNFALDDEINAEVLGEIASYAKSTKTESTPLIQALKEATKQYLYRLRHNTLPVSYEYPMTDYPWNVSAMVLYIAAFATLFVKKKKEALLPVLLFACRTALWIYIILRGRDPIRITHPMYLVEMLILLGIVIREYKADETDDKQREARSMSGRAVPVMMVIVLLLTEMVAVPGQIGIVARETDQREEMVKNYGELKNYFDSNKDSYYFVDVYTSVSYAAVKGAGAATYSEKMFKGVDNSFTNHDLLGGWASKSPLYQKKLEHAGFDNVQDALLSENVYFVVNKTEDTSWLSDYYEEKGTTVEIAHVDTVADIFEIYSVSRIN